MDKSKKFRMPAGIRNKLTAAIAMLLVSSIMMVSSTYAWFTLSTAPEVTGITTSVGANGNLEMALLNSETFKDLTKIASAVGDSSAATGNTVEQANITWGNLVDLSAASYGLQFINLQPARLNIVAGAEGNYNLGSTLNLLKMPVYGKDGRVSELSADTYATVYANNSWAFSTDPEAQTYGVRAIGSNDNLTPQEAGLIAAKTAYNTSLRSAQSTLQTALSQNGNMLASAIVALATGQEMSDDQKNVISDLVQASDTALDHIDNAYKQVLLGYAASILSDETVYNQAVTEITEATSYSAALTALEAAAGVTVTVPSALETAVTKLNTQRAAVEAAQDALTQDPANYSTALSKLVDTDEVTINDFSADQILLEGNQINDDFFTAVITDGGAVVKMPNESGVFAYVASVAGNYSADCSVTVEFDGRTYENLPAKLETTATVDTTVATALNGLDAASGTSGTTVLSDTFGYALDFAFRTNAAESYLLLQTAAAQRVYSDSTNATTQGAGATMTFQVTTTSTGIATLKENQVKALMSAIRVAFVNPDDESGEIYGIAALSNITQPSGGTFEGELYLHDYTVDDKGIMTLGAKKTEGPEEGVDPAAIMKLNQSEAARLTVIVWLDGDMVDNADVANAAQSLVGTMNLQFSSSAELIPMQNTALENLAITYTELDGTDYKAGLYNFNNVEYALKTGYKLYMGSDNALYFSNDGSTYTKLTVVTYSTAMAPLTVSVTGDASIDKGAETTLTASASAGTIESVTWTITTGNAVTIAADEVNTDATVKLTGAADGEATVTAAITVKFAEGVTRSAEVKFDVVVGSYTVSFDANGGTGEMAAVNGVAGSYTLPANGFTRADTETHTYAFAGWDVDGTVYQPDETITVSKDTVVKATWTETAKTPAAGDEDENQQTPTTYTVTFNANDGDANQTTEKAVATIADAPAVEREGYTLLGWSVDQAAVTPDESITLADDLILYAVWQQNP